MPTISLTQLIKYAFTIALAVVIIALFVRLSSSFIEYITISINSIISSNSTIDGLDLGYVAKEVGLVDFLNALMNSVLIASNVFIGSISSIYSIKFIIKLYETAKGI